MYINFKLAQAYGLIPSDVMVLQAIFQNRTEDNSNLLEHFDDSLEKFEQQGLIKYIQGTKKSSKYQLVRISDKGAKILEEIQIPEVNSDDLSVYSWLEGVYKKEGKDIGNMKKTKLLIALFRANSGIERNHLAFLCKVFIKDEKEMEYSKKLEYLFFKPPNVYQIKFDIEQSRLYQYYLKRKEWFDIQFSLISN